MVPRTVAWEAANPARVRSLFLVRQANVQVCASGQVSLVALEKERRGRVVPSVTVIESLRSARYFER